MGTGDMTARENHHHQRSANSQRRDGDTANYRATNSQDEKESPDEFGQIFWHVLRMVLGIVAEFGI